MTFRATMAEDAKAGQTVEIDPATGQIRVARDERYIGAPPAIDPDAQHRAVVEGGTAALVDHLVNDHQHTFDVTKPHFELEAQHAELHQVSTGEE